MAGVLDGGNAIGINCGYGGCGQLNSFKQNTNANNIRIYGDNAYIFCGSTLVTIIRVPANIRKDMQKMIRREPNE